jgi:hypothetical protein
MPKKNELENETEVKIKKKISKVSREKNISVKENKATKFLKEKNKKSVENERNVEIEKSNKVLKNESKVAKKAEDKKIDEETVIEKIKSFIAKIAAMQEEALKEEKEKTVEKTEKENKIKTKIVKTTKPDYLLEYYDLPYRYNETVVKILAQTPKRLFVYWDVSDNDREKYVKTFGEDFFNKTYPVLLLYNEDKKYIKEIPINDFANSWYIDIPDPKNKYIIQLGRKFKSTPEIVNMAKFEEEKIILRTDYLPFADSNELEVPNDHILLESLPRYITFRNVKTNQETVKDLRSFVDIFGNTYDVTEFYNTEYKDEISEGMFDMANPSSNLSSSSFK